MTEVYIRFCLFVFAKVHRGNRAQSDNTRPVLGFNELKMKHFKNNFSFNLLFKESFKAPGPFFLLLFSFY